MAKPTLNTIPQIQRAIYELHERMAALEALCAIKPDVVETPALVQPTVRRGRPRLTDDSAKEI